MSSALCALVRGEYMSEARPPGSPGLRPPMAIPAQPQRPVPGHPQPAHPVQPQPASHLPKVGALPTSHAKVDESELESIGLVEEAGTEAEEKKIKAFGIIGAHKAREWKRKPTVTGTGAVRVKSFHGKLSDQGMLYIDEAINEWLDNHPEV